MGTEKRRYYENLLGKVMEQFETEDFEDNSKLKPIFLLAYHCQLNQLSGKKNVSKEEK